ncbi:MAG: RHS repeat-associated core domain-containing protein, partial [Muribaculaceae bacterium]|nr:RHS repeat-associated core domain-containing protein [Muribaculaceae bacterium]
GGAFGDICQRSDLYRYSGKELDKISGLDWYDFSARHLDPAYCRFTTPNPLAEQYPDLSPYAYCMGNPIKFIDPTGCTVNISDLINAYNSVGDNFAQMLISDLAHQTGLVISFDEYGNLTYKKDDDGKPIVTSKTNEDGEEVEEGSQTARDYLIQLIEDERTLTVAFGKESVSHPKKNLIGFGIKQVEAFISGANNLDNRTLGYGMVFFHESMHTLMGGNMRDATYGTGGVVDKMNQIREELNKKGYNYGKRESYTNIMINGVFYIPFDRDAYRRLDQNKRPSRNSKYIYY